MSTPRHLLSDTFRSLRSYNYCVWSAGALVSNIGTWMQRTAQDWLVLTALPGHSASAVGTVTALQFGPQLLLLPWTGYAADRFDRRRLLALTQGIMGLLALGLGILTLLGRTTLLTVDVFAFLLGCVAAFDAPARQIFVAELVPRGDLPNAVALNSTSFNLARTVGPALAGLAVAFVGAGEVFILNAFTFGAVLLSLVSLRRGQLFAEARQTGGRGKLADGFRYVAGRPDLQVVMAMQFLFGTFGLNFAIYIATMSVGAFDAGAGAYGLLTATMAVGSVGGALLAAGRSTPGLPRLCGAAALFALGCAAAALSPNVWLFGLVLAATGVAVQTFMTAANSVVQLSTEPAMRGRVMAILLAIALGGTPIGGPFAGFVADRAGPRWAMGIGAAAGIAVALAGLWYLRRHRGLRLLRGGRVDIALEPDPYYSAAIPTEAATLAGPAAARR